MCRSGEERICRVLVCAEDSFDGKARWTWKGVDSCLADKVDELNKAGRFTRTCCCGHGKGGGSIVLQDGTVIPV